MNVLRGLSTSPSLTAKRLSYLLVPMVLFFAFAKLGQQPVHQWDEARTGINAIEMLRNGDWINLHFGGEPDEIRAKPPLVVWMVALNFKFFGYNTFSLRLHSAIATVLIFFFLYRIVRLYKGVAFSAGVVLVVLSVRGILGFHVGRTGDFDAVLIAFLLMGLYHFLRHYDFNRKDGIYWAAVSWGLAFFVKGPAMGVLFPGLVLYITLTGGWKKLLHSRTVYLAGFLCLFFPLIWYTVVHFYGSRFEEPVVSGQTVFERMFLYDLRDRFTQTEFEGKIEQRDFLFFFRCLKENFALWHYLFYAVVVIGIIRYLFSKKELWANMMSRHRLLVLSVCLWSTLGVFLSLVTVAKFWYLAPAIPFVAVTLVYGLEWGIRRYRWLLIPLSFYWMAAMYFRYLGPKPEATSGSKQSDFFTELISEHEQMITQRPRIIQVGALPAQRVLLELFFENPNVVYHPDLHKRITSNEKVVIFARNEAARFFPDFFQRVTLIDKDEHYSLYAN